MMCEIVTAGWLTVDDIVLRDGTCHFATLGGGALYSAVGAHLWNASVGIHAAAGDPYAEMTRKAVWARGIDSAGISKGEGNGLELWLLHETVHDKQQLPKVTSTSAELMDKQRGSLPSSYEKARGYHVAPQWPQSSRASAAAFQRLGGIVTMDILSDNFIDASLYQDLAFLKHLTAFLPSEAEIQRIWHPASLETWLVEAARNQGCHMVAKLGEDGSLLAEGGSGKLIHTPCLRVPAKDTTGAGDAYCGGFLAGLVAGRSIAECAAMGTVSASYVVEGIGALATPVPSARDLEVRLDQVLGGSEHRDARVEQRACGKGIE